MRSRDDDGATTILTVALITGLVVLMTAIVATGQLAIARGRSAMVADLAALAAARQASCAAAGQTVHLHGARILECSWSGTDVTVRVSVKAAAPLLDWSGLAEIDASSRAGF